MKTTQAVLEGKDMTIEPALHMSFELGDKAWKLTFSDGRRNPGRFAVAAGDQAAVLECIERAKARCGLPTSAGVHSCYEAGRDGWWLHRWLKQQGIDNIVVDSSSIEVNRRARRAKSDRLDGDKLLQMLLRHRRGERVWSVVHEPSAQAEDERRVHRELQRLTHEHTAHCNRIRTLLVLHNLRPAQVGGRVWAAWWAAHQAQIPPLLRAEIERECQRLELVRQQARDRGAAAPGAEPTAPGPAAQPPARHWPVQRLGAHEGAVRLAAVRQPTPARQQHRDRAHALRQRLQ